MELPIYEIASNLQLLFGKVIASAEVRKHFFADRPGSINGFVIDLFVIEKEVHDVKVVAPINSTHHWHSIDKMMRKFMSVALNYSINSPLRNRIQKQTHLVSWAASTLLKSWFLPVTTSVIRITVISHMTHQNNSVGSTFSQFSTTFEHYFCVLFEFIGREVAIFECSCCGWCFNSGESDDSDLDPWLQCENKHVFMFG